MNTPQQPKDPPKQGASVEHDTGQSPKGIPDGAADATPKGLPNSDRHDTETAPAKD